MAQPLKDNIDAQVVDLLSRRLAERCATFDASAFLAAVLPELDSLELKARIALIADSLADHLTGDYAHDLSIIVSVAESDVGEWASWPLCTFVERTFEITESEDVGSRLGATEFGFVVGIIFGCNVVGWLFRKRIVRGKHKVASEHKR